MVKKSTKPKKPAAKPSKPTQRKEDLKPVEAAAVQETKAAPEPKKVNLTNPVVREAIAQGQAIIKEGKSKADAARAIYAALKDEDKDLIVAAFVEGATLTPKGALTYWYNCKRWAAREERQTSAT